MSLKIGLLTLGAPVFRYDVPQKYLENTQQLISNLHEVCVGPNKVILDKKDLDEGIENLLGSRVDMVVVQLGTFTPGDFLVEIIQKLGEKPLFAWGFNDPILEDFPTVPMNSLTALTMFTSYLKKMNYKFSYCYEDYNKDMLPKKLLMMIKALKAKKALESAKYVVVGSRVPGFYLNTIDELKLRQTTGIEVVYYSIAEWIDSAKKIDDDLIEKEFQKKFQGSTIPVTKEIVKNNLRLEMALLEYIKLENITGVALKCWPELQSLLNCTGCMINSNLIDMGIMASCEADLPGLVMMDILNKLTEKPIFFADIVAKTKDDCLKAWHCGVGPKSLAEEDSKCEYIEQATMRNGIGLAHQFDMKTGPVTICQLNQDEFGFSIFSESGIAQKKDRELLGVQTDIMLRHPFDEVLDKIIENGFGQHFAIVHEDIQLLMSEYCKWSNITQVLCTGGVAIE